MYLPRIVHYLTLLAVLNLLCGGFIPKLPANSIGVEHSLVLSQLPSDGKSVQKGVPGDE